MGKSSKKINPKTRAKTKPKARAKTKPHLDDQNYSSWRTPIFWRNLLLYFLFFSYIGHYIEMAAIWLCHVLFGAELKLAIYSNPLEPYTIYGVGAVLCVILVRPIVKKLNHHIIATYLVATLVCAVLELSASVALTIRYGHNPYWQYFDRPFNLAGHICLTNSLFFGLLATIFVRLVHPRLEKLLKTAPQIIVNTILLVLIVMFAFYYLPIQSL